MPVAGLSAFLQNFSTGEMVVIAIVALVVLGPERLPEMARGLGKMLHKLKTMGESLREEMGDVIDHPTMEPIKQLGELAANPRQKLAEYAMEAEAEERRKRAEAESVAAVPDDVDGAHVTDELPEGDQLVEEPAASVGEPAPPAEVNVQVDEPVTEPVEDVASEPVPEPTPEPAPEPAPKPALEPALDREVPE